MSRSSAREALAVVGAFGIVAVATTWPLVLRLGDALPVSLGSRPLLNALLLAWDADRLLHGLQGWWDLPIFHRYTNVLAFSENLLGIALFTAPIQRLTGNPVVAEHRSRDRLGHHRPPAAQAAAEQRTADLGRQGRCLRAARCGSPRRRDDGQGGGPRRDHARRRGRQRGVGSSSRGRAAV